MRFLFLAAPALLLAACASLRPAAPSALAEAKALFAAQRYAEAAARLTDVEIHKLGSREEARAYELRGEAEERLRRPDEALRTYQTGVALFPRDLNLLTNLGDLLHHNGLDDQARPFYERVLSIHPNNAASHLGLAEAERKLGFLDRAAAHYEATLVIQGDQADLWRDYAEVLMESRRLPQALEAISRSLALRQEPAACVVEARVLWKLGRKADAYAALARAERMTGARADLKLQRGLWRLESGELDLAAADAAAALKLDASDPLGLWLRASVSLRRGRILDARKDLERAVRQRGAPFVAAAAGVMLKQLP